MCPGLTFQNVRQVQPWISKRLSESFVSNPDIEEVGACRRLYVPHLSPWSEQRRAYLEPASLDYFRFVFYKMSPLFNQGREENKKRETFFFQNWIDFLAAPYRVELGGQKQVKSLLSEGTTLFYCAKGRGLGALLLQKASRWEFKRTS